MLDGTAISGRDLDRAWTERVRREWLKRRCLAPGSGDSLLDIQQPRTRAEHQLHLGSRAGHQAGDGTRGSRGSILLDARASPLGLAGRVGLGDWGAARGFPKGGVHVDRGVRWTAPAPPAAYGLPAGGPAALAASRGEANQGWAPRGLGPPPVGHRRATPHQAPWGSPSRTCTRCGQKSRPSR